MPAMKTPGVYIVEKSAFPNSVVEVATAVPAFIGYTQKAENGDKSLLNKPWRISSMKEFEKYFGDAPTPKFTIEDAASLENADFKIRIAGDGRGKGKSLKQESAKFILFSSMRLFFQNGGGACYIVSVGDYDGDEDGDGKGEIKADELQNGVATLIKEPEPTMIVIPETMSLPSLKACTSVQQAVLLHCGNKMRNRVAILDVFDGYKDRQDAAGDCIAAFRDALGINYLDFAAAYYPWVNTTIVSDSVISFNYLTEAGKSALVDILNTELKVGVTDDIPMEAPVEAGDTPSTAESSPTKEGKMMLDNREMLGKELLKVIELSDAVTAKITLRDGGDQSLAGKNDADIKSLVLSERALLNKSLMAVSPLYVQVLKSISARLNLLPPAAAMAGVYTAIDNTRGVWKAPANVSLSSVSAPSVNITHDDQEDLNVTTQGKSINAIRSFIGEGTLVWGARTLDGNSLDWRYISVRRTMIMMEESLRLGTKAYVFEANNAQTWITIKSMIRNFLTGIWKRGGLAGSSPDDAFSVYVGLGETMTPEDILEGILRVSILVAVTRPAEFIEITFTQQMQKS
ncbi:phage tail sheath family protein [Teredinibacter haidensis]|uniref:phage tail sheath family protein n=1 Tax=Teredinibacter haidensis TaxID=2731755 RepID=UPI000948C1A5|nr:phage tail sheath C-terminal domain-containing protein [Teredinibacter haidensis]